jgi:hypothetical protein
VVACERRLAEQEALVVRIKQGKEDTSNAQAELEMMRTTSVVVSRSGNDSSRCSNVRGEA